MMSGFGGLRGSDWIGVLVGILGEYGRWGS